MRRSVDGGRSWVDCELPEPGVFSLAVSAADGAVYAGTEPSRLFRSDDRGESWQRAGRAARAALAAELELPAAAVDLARALDRAQPARRRPAPGRDRARRPDALDRRRAELAGPPSRRATRRALARLAPAHAGARVRSGRRRRRLQHRRAARPGSPPTTGRDRHYTWSVAVDPDDPDCWYVSASTGPYAAHGRRDPQARIYRRRDGEPWQPLTGGLPEPLPAMPYALLATDGRLFAGLADGQLWESRDQGDSWSPLRLNGDAPDALVALG